MAEIYILNNNCVLVKEENGVEKILMGKGIGYNEKKGNGIQPEDINKTFVFSNSSLCQKMQETIVSVPAELVEIVDKTVTKAQLYLKKKLNDYIYISLTDHLYHSIQRNRNGTYLKNALVWEIKKFYPEEYALGEYVMKLIKQEYQIELTEDDAAFIALHIVNCEAKEIEYDRNIYKETEMLQTIVEIVENWRGETLNSQSFHTYRFITHLRFFVERACLGAVADGNSKDGELLNLIKEKCPMAYDCTKNIKKVLWEKFHYVLTQEEMFYLMIHIKKLID